MQPGRIEAIYKSKHATPITPSCRHDECVDISKIPFCSNLNYPKAHFPNYRGHDSPAEANSELRGFNDLVNTNCSNAIVHLLCAVYAPFCYVEEKQGTSKLHPCIELCQHVRSGCESVVNSYGLDWPPHLDCNNSDIYKSSSEFTYCPDDLSTLVIPSTQATSTTPDVPPTYIKSTYEEPTHHTNPSLVPPLSRCVIVSQIPFCSNLNYSKAHFPNFRGHDSPAEANSELRDFNDLVNTNCSNAIVHLLCAVYAPFCYVEEKQGTIKLHPCIELCQHVRSGCESVVNSYGLDWPPHLDCNNSDIYKSSSEFTYCPDDLSTLVIPSTQATSTTPDVPPTYIKSTYEEPTHHTNPSLVPPLSRCVIVSQIPFCSNLNYSKAHFPNFRGHDSPAEANSELSDFTPLVTTSCSNAIVHLLCAVYAPFCYVDEKHGTSKLHPCIELCQYVRDGCESVVNSHGLDWPPHLDCNNSDIYKSSSELTYCPDDLSTLVIPSTPATTTTPTVPPTYIKPTYEEPTTYYVESIHYVEPVQCECKSIDHIPLCSNIGYNQTYQNFRGLSIIETNIELSSYQSLIDTSCSDYLINLLCSVYAPPCNGTSPVVKLRPCRALCKKVKDDCWSNLDIYDNWSELFDCENNTALYQNDDEFSYCPLALLHGM